MSRKNRRPRPPEILAEHPPAQCRKFVGNRTIKLLDEIARSKSKPGVAPR